MASTFPSPLKLASATLHFLDFASKFIENTSRSDEAIDGISQEPAEINREAEKLKQADVSSDELTLTRSNTLTLTRTTSALSRTTSKGGKEELHQTEPERAIQRIYDRCISLADKLVPALQACQMQDEAGKMVIKAGIKKKSDVEKLNKEIDVLNAECCTQLQRLLNERRSNDVRGLDQLRQRDASMEANVSQRFEQLRRELLGSLSQQQQNKTKPNRTPSAILVNMLQEVRYVNIAQDILLNMRYDGMSSRKHTIAETHGDTYEWIFSSPKAMRRQNGLKANFSDWLQSQGGIFWVTGHPGSGKSTLMKFADNHNTTREKLEEWAKGYKLVRASHYFWVNGSAVQKSQLGLLRALCFAIFRQCPDLLPQLCEERWNAGSFQQDPQKEWTISELQGILHRLQTSEFKVTNEKVRFCFFIDGLDEYSGDYEELLTDLRQLATSPHIKICAASRPWNLFEEALGQDPTRMLTMQELTSDDIASYVRDTLDEDERFTALEKKDPRAQTLEDDIIERANGVFLWVYLVLRRVQRSLKNGDSLETIEKNIHNFPSNLDDYFRHMLDTEDVFKQRETAQVFRVCIRARQPLALIAFSVLDPENPISQRLESNESVDKREVAAMHEKMQNQIELRGPDLLEVVRDGKYIHVTFTHRSVRDFLTHNNMDTLFEERAGKDFKTGEEFEPLATLCDMTTLTLKRLDLITEPSTAREHYYTLIEDCLDYAEDMEIAHRKPAVAELNKLEEILSRTKNIASTLDTNTNSPLLPLAVRRNLCLYIQARADSTSNNLQPTITYPDRPLLSYALPVFHLKSTVPLTFHPDMTRFLLETGSNPNALTWLKDHNGSIERKGSIWYLYLRTLYSMAKRPRILPTNSSSPLLTTELLLEAGAQYEPSCLTEDGNKGEREILEFVFGKSEAGRLVGLRAQTALPVRGTEKRTGSGTGRRPSWAKAKSGLRRLSVGVGGGSAVAEAPS